MRFGGYNINHPYKVWVPVFEGEDTGGNATANDDTSSTDASTSEVDSQEQQQQKKGDETKVSGKFSSEQQKEINRILAAEKKKHQKVVQKAVDEANALRSKAQLTAAERQDLDNRLELIQNEMRTKEEQAKRAADKLRKKHKEERESLIAERDTWKTRFTESTIERSLTDAAAANNAFSPKQIVAILGRNTSLVPVLDEDGKPTGGLEPKVRFQSKDKEGNPVTLDMSPSDAVKRMKDEEEFLNLFRGEGSGGAGLRSQPGGKKVSTVELAKDPAAYRKARKDGTLNFQ